VDEESPGDSRSRQVVSVALAGHVLIFLVHSQVSYKSWLLGFTGWFHVYSMYRDATFKLDLEHEHSELQVCESQDGHQSLGVEQQVQRR
jgi:hypothetical protein